MHVAEPSANQEKGRSRLAAEVPPASRICPGIGLA